MFDGLSDDAKDQLLAAVELLDSVSFEWQSKLTFRIGDVFQSSDSVLTRLDDRLASSYAVIYAISTVKPGKEANLLSAFSKSKNAKESERAYCRKNEEPSRCLYVGSSRSFGSRLKQHLGYGPKDTYALNIRYWAVDFENEKLEVSYASYSKDISPATVQTLEDALWERQQPMFGRKGTR